MNITFNKKEITWVDKEYLSKSIAKDLAGFWINSNTDKLYCARESEIGIAHYYFDSKELKWKFDYFTEVEDDFKEDTGTVFDLKLFKTVIVDNVLYIVENNIFTMKFSIEDTKLYWKQQLEIDVENICFQYLPLYVKVKKPSIAYTGDFKFIVFETSFIEDYIRFSSSL